MMAAKLQTSLMQSTLIPLRPSPVVPPFHSNSNLRLTLKTSITARTNTTLVANANANANATASSVVVADRLNNQATPWLMLQPEEDGVTGEKLDCFYSLADGQTVRLNRKKALQVPDTTKCVGSTIESWLAFVDTKDGSFYLSNPFLNDIVELPSLEFLPSVVGVDRDKSGSILNFKVSYSDYARTWDKDNFNAYDLKDPEYMANNSIFHVALSWGCPRYVDCVAMVVQGDMERLAYCSIGKKFNPDYRSPKTCSINDGTFWNGLQEDYIPGCSSNQVVYSANKGLFYSLFDDVGIQAFDLERHRGWRSKMVYQFYMSDLESKLNDHFEDDEESESLKEMRKKCKSKYYLVTLANGDLLLLVRHYLLKKNPDSIPPYKTLHFDVFKVAYPGILERVSSLEDRAIFIGGNQSFCIKAGASPGIRPNSIYFTDDLGLKWGHDIGIFSMRDGIIRPFYPYHDEEDIEKEVPLTKPLFWVAPVSLYAPLARGNEYCIEG